MYYKVYFRALQASASRARLALAIAGLIAFAPLALVHADDAAPSVGDLESRLRTLLREHPRLRERRLLLAAAREEERFASRTYPDPELMLGRTQLAARETMLYPDVSYRDISGSESELRVQQSIPFPGKLTLDARVQALQADREQLTLAIEENNLVGEFLNALIDLERAERAREFTRVFVGQSAVVARAARTRYESGGGALAEAAGARVKEQSYRERSLALDGVVQARRAELAYFAGAAPESGIAGSSRAELDEFLARLRQRAGERGAQAAQHSLESALAQVAARSADTQRSRAWLEYLPDFAVFAGYRRERTSSSFLEARAMEQDAYTVGVTIRVPLWSAFSTHTRISGAGDARGAAFAAAEDAGLRVQTLFNSVEQTRAALDARLRIMRAEILPGARIARDSARANYEAGRGDLAGVLRAAEELYDLELELLDLEAELRRAIVLQAGLVNVLIPPETRHTPEEAQP